VLTLHEGRFVPERGTATLDEIDERWEALRAANPAYHDGPVYHVLGVHRNGHGGASIHVIESSYRFQAVQRDGFDVGHRGLGVRGTVRSAGSEKLLLGKRSQNVGRYPGMWEFAPAGGLPVGAQPAAAIVQELSEETGLELAAPPVAVAVMFDAMARTWEIIFAIDGPTGEARCRTGEYMQLAWFSLTELPEPLSPVTVMMARLLRE